MILIYIKPQHLSHHGGVAGTEGGAWRTAKYGKNSKKGAA